MWDLTILGPLVLPTDLLLLLGREVVGDVKSLTDLLRGFALDHIRNGLAAYVQEGLDIQVVGRLREKVSLGATHGWRREAGTQTRMISNSIS